MRLDDFTDFLHHKAAELFRPMPWREDTRPYYVFVSELMLQQTQVTRVIPKFTAFIDAFPDEQALAAAPLAGVLGLWQGLGYNRRAKYLHDAAKRIVGEFNGRFPSSQSDILSLPGVGSNTCGAIEAYAFNRPSLFVETNVRTVYIHHFFADNFAVTDAQIKEVLRQTINTQHPREFYWALMDYGASLKASGIRNIDQSRHYKKQSPLKGSTREMRGKIIKRLTAGPAAEGQLKIDVHADARYAAAMNGLISDGLVTVEGATVRLTK